MISSGPVGQLVGGELSHSICAVLSMELSPEVGCSFGVLCATGLLSASGLLCIRIGNVP